MSSGFKNGRLTRNVTNRLKNRLVLVNKLLQQYIRIILICHTISLAFITRLCTPVHWLPHRTHAKRPQRFLQLV
jgi:hypothetical protein